jgi:hypothetical protein
MLCVHSVRVQQLLTYFLFFLPWSSLNQNRHIWFLCLTLKIELWGTEIPWHVHMDVINFILWTKTKLVTKSTYKFNARVLEQCWCLFFDYRTYLILNNDMKEQKIITICFISCAITYSYAAWKLTYCCCFMSIDFPLNARITFLWFRCGVCASSGCTVRGV